MQKVAVVQGLQTQVAKELVTLGPQHGGQALEVKRLQALVQQACGQPALDQARQLGAAALGHRMREYGLAPDFFHQAVQQQAGAGPAVIGLDLDQAARRQHQGVAHVGARHAVVEVF